MDFISLKNRNDFSFGFSYFKRALRRGTNEIKLQVGEKITFERTLRTFLVLQEMSFPLHYGVFC
ncbi:hypothetical protein B7P25_16505 [Bacillus thuringiensis]|uniref:Uncharacterized protein n=1 Tax=Bacillus cereus (strain ZK / E33L) TaxID=288681 RepID=Q638W4_BACCZ|nr:hypothetical protein BCE33L2966 [Bacillus cereus E33L]ARZ63315.1 hypothetical protein B7P25_16505 [Bacillus thuringiensis]